MMKQFLFKILYLMTFSSLLFCQKTGSYAGGFLRMGASARSVAMGGSFTAEVDQSFSAYHNPASLVYIKNPRASFKIGRAHV